ncbi:Thyrostimulin alpha-2 subunit [Eumeta japonica]|uniref:Thyrostimulin alpha-2 subunit n=1 Tax=Eumeta variegata TaxID=151549 RepID=A0A4C1YVF3_EUMVA|nr:Thyrostimulin alpha-2 subunit [Eumeta japonica]
MISRVAVIGTLARKQVVSYPTRHTKLVRRLQHTTPFQRPAAPLDVVYSNSPESTPTEFFVDKLLYTSRTLGDLGYTRQENITDCVSFRVTTNACLGYCESWSLPSIVFGFKRHPVTSQRHANIGQMSRQRASQTVRRDAVGGQTLSRGRRMSMRPNRVSYKVLCLDGERNLVYKSATSCACYHCQKL